MTTADPSTVAAPLVLAYLINYLLYGVSVVQFLLYLIQYPRDRSSLKMLVWLIFLLETVTTAVVGFVGWATFGEGFGDIVSLNYLPSGWALFPFISGIITTIVQNFLSWRIYRLTNRIWLSGVIFVISVVGCAFSFFFGVRVIQLGLHYDSPQAAGKYLDVWISCAAVCDVLGTGAIVTILAKSYSKTLRGSTRTMVSNLLKFSVETGLVATIWAIIHVSLWATMPQTSFHYIFYFSLPRLYSNWLFAVLNSRLYLASFGQVVTVDFRAQSSLWSDLPAARAHNGPTAIHPQVHIKTTEVVLEGIDPTRAPPNKYNHAMLDSSSV